MMPTGLVRPGPRRVAMAFVGLALVASACGRSSGSDGVVRIHTAHGVVAVQGPVADTDAARARGLRGRARLGPDEGMAFVFAGPTDQAFWMKDTVIPLSVAFWNRSGRIVAIRDMASCRSDPCRTYRPAVSYLGAVEVLRGWFEANGVRVGDRVELER
jgi:uncharacterized membrane protein (UPF0127 family)